MAEDEDEDEDGGRRAAVINAARLLDSHHFPLAHPPPSFTTRPAPDHSPFKDIEQDAGGVYGQEIHTCTIFAGL